MFSIGKSIFEFQKCRYDYKYNQPVIVTYLPGALSSVAGASKPRTKEVWSNVCVTHEKLISITVCKYDWPISISKNLCLSSSFFFSASGNNQKNAVYMNIKSISPYRISLKPHRYYPSKLEYYEYS